MCKEEFMNIAAIMKAVYTFPGFLPDDKAITIWFGLLKDMDYKEALQNLQYFMQTETRQPTPADIRRNPVAKEQSCSEGEAWTMVYKALCNSNYHALEEFDRLPPMVQRAVGSPDQLRIWAADPEFNEGVAASNFKRSYRACLDHDIQRQMISPGLNTALENRGRQLLQTSEEALLNG